MFKNTIEYAVKQTGLSEKDLATNLGVESEQLTKWRSGHSIPVTVLKKLKIICFPNPGTFCCEDFIGSSDWTSAWQDYLTQLHDDGFSCEVFKDDKELCISKIMNLFLELEIKIPFDSFPDEKKYLSEEYEFTSFDILVRRYFESLSFLSQWCCSHLPLDEELMDYYFEINDLIIDFAISHVNNDILSSNGLSKTAFKNYTSKTRRELIHSIALMCDEMKKLNLPFTVDYFDLVNDSLYDFDDKSLFNSLSLDAKPSIVQYFSYQDRRIFESVNYTNRAVDDLVFRFNSLMADIELLKQKLGIDAEKF